MNSGPFAPDGLSRQQTGRAAKKLVGEVACGHTALMILQSIHYMADAGGMMAFVHTLQNQPQYDRTCEW